MTSYTLWMVENLDPTMSCGAGLRLLNLGTGGYLMNHSVVPSFHFTGFHYNHLCIYIGFVVDKQSVVLKRTLCTDSTSSMCLPSLKHPASRLMMIFRAQVHSTLHLIYLTTTLPSSVCLNGICGRIGTKTIKRIYGYTQVCEHA